MRSSVKNILFDLGQVLIDLDVSKTEKAFKKLLPSANSNFFSFYQQTSFFNAFETGSLSEDAFRDTIKKVSHKNLSRKCIDKAWNTMLVDFPIKKINFLKQLREQKYKLYVLSNTNSIHIRYINEVLLSSNEQMVEDFFNEVFYSYKIGFRKPDKKAYTYVLKHAKINAEETLFIDDRIENIKAAKNLYFQTWHLKNPNDLYKF